VIRLAQIRAGSDADAIANDLDEAERVSDEIHTRTQAALEATNDFSRSARTAIAGEGPLARLVRVSRSLGPRRTVRDSCEEDVAAGGEIEAPR
jgi:hypothetical protein